jgi:hypothetical protein
MDSGNSSFSREIEAMAAIGRALGDLTDPAARERVLRWVNERFAATSATSMEQPVKPASVLVTASDADLAVDNLSDMFTCERPAEVDEDLMLPEQVAAMREELPAKTEPIETVLRSFAADFQRFVDEWNGAAA